MIWLSIIRVGGLIAIMLAIDSLDVPWTTKAGLILGLIFYVHGVAAFHVAS